jgi:competence ComEA-like helix-hairpin-helix protein
MFIRFRDQETIAGLLIVMLIGMVISYWGTVDISRGVPVCTYQYKVDLNTAPASEFEILPGLGPKLSEAVIEYREQHGRFNSIEEIDNVRGIGPKKLEVLRPFLYIGEETLR